MWKRLLAGGIVGSLMLVVTFSGGYGSAGAATIRNWRGAPGSNWSEATNWSPGGAPETGDFLTIGKQATAGTVNNNISNLSLQRLTLDDRDYVIQGNPLNVAEIVVTDGGIITYNAITLNLSGEARTLVTKDGSLSLSGDNTFSGDIDVYGRLRVGSNTALGTAAGRTLVGPGGELELAGRDLGGEIVRLSGGDTTAYAVITNSLDSVIPNLEVGGSVALENSGTLNLPNGLKEYFPGFEMFLAGSGDFLIGGTSNVSGTVYLLGEASLAWNSAGQVAFISDNSFTDEPSTGDLTGSGSASSVDFRGGTFSPGAGNASGRFTLAGPLKLQDATLSILMNNTQTATGYSQARAASVTLGPNVELQLVQNFDPAPGNNFQIVDVTGTQPVSGTFKDLPEGAKFIRGGHTYTITYKGGSGNDVVITRVTDDPRPFRRVMPMVAKNP